MTSKYSRQDCRKFLKLSNQTSYYKSKWIGIVSGMWFYHSPLILTELFQHDQINVSYLTACYLYQVMMTLHFLHDVANDAESTQK